MFAEFFHVPGGCFPPVSDSQLCIVDGILAVFIIEKFHDAVTPNEIYHNYTTYTT